MNRRSLLAPAAASLLLLAACAGGEVTEIPEAPAVQAEPEAIHRVDTPSEDGYFLTVEGPAQLTADLGAEVAVAVTYYQDGGVPVAGADVSFWLEGQPGEAQLMARTARTDADGQARVTVLVGSVIARFEVAANAHLADDVTVSITIEPGAAPQADPEPEVVLPPQVAGSYDVRSRYDLASKLGGSEDTIRGIGRAFSDPGRFLSEHIDIGGFVGDLVQGIIGDLINQMIASYAPAWVQNAITIGDDIIALVTNLRVRSELVVAKVHADGSFEGTHQWKAVSFEWELGCPPDVEGCGDRELLLPPGTGVANITGMATHAGQVTINEHEVDANIAPIAVLLVSQVILPSRTGHTSFGGMLSEMLDCRNLGQAGEQAIGVPFTANIITAGCRAGLERAGAALQRQIEGALEINLGSQIGTARTFDDNGDGSPERWGNGAWTQLPGTFTANRI